MIEDLQNIICDTVDKNMNTCITCKTYPLQVSIPLCITCKRKTRHEIDIVEKIKYMEKQQKYSQLLMQAITDVCKPEFIKKIINRHFQLMKEYDEKDIVDMVKIES